MGYISECRAVWFCSLVFFIYASQVASSPVYDRWPDLTRRVPQKMDPPGCAYKGQKFVHGEQVETPEPCLNCTCIKAVLVCYLRVCPTAVAPPPGCFPAREPGQCCPTLVCGINDLIPQLGGDSRSDASTSEEDSSELRPTFKPSATSGGQPTTDTTVEVDDTLGLKPGSPNLQSTNYKATVFNDPVSTISTAVPKFESTVGNQWTSEDGTPYQTSEFNNHQKMTSSYADSTVASSSMMELDTSGSKEPSTTWFSVPDAIAKITITVQDPPSSSESSEMSNLFTDVDKSTDSKELYPLTLITSAAPTKISNHGFDTKSTDSLLFVTSTMASPHDHFADYDMSFLNDIPGGCLVNGTLYGDGSAMLSSSFCEYCFCIRGKQTCLKPKCHLAIEGCVAKYDSEYTCCPSRYDCSQRERPIESSLLDAASSEAPTTTEHFNKEGLCQVGKKVYAVGHVVPDYQLCHNCYCNDSNIVCHKISCSPPVEGCQPIIPAGKCCPISYRCDLPQADAAEMNLQSGNDIPPPAKLELETKETTPAADKSTSESTKDSSKSPISHGIKTSYSHRVKGHPKPVVAQPVSHRVKTPNRKTPISHRIKHPLAQGGQKASGIKNTISIERRVDDINSTLDEIDDVDSLTYDPEDAEEKLLIGNSAPILVGNVYTESALRQSRHDTTMGVSTEGAEDEEDFTKTDPRFVTKSMEQSPMVTSSRGNDKTLNIDDLDLGTLLLSTMRAISAMSSSSLDPTKAEPLTSSRTSLDGSGTTDKYSSTKHQEEPATSFSSTELPEVQTISLEELFRKFIKTAVNRTESGPTYQVNKNTTSNTIRNNSKQPTNMDDVPMRDAPSVDEVYANRTSITPTDATTSKDSSDDSLKQTTYESSQTITPSSTSNQTDDKQEGNQPISRDPLLDFETRPISLESTSLVPEPVYLVTANSTIKDEDILKDSNDLLSNQTVLPNTTNPLNSSVQFVNELLADQPALEVDEKSTIVNELAKNLSTTVSVEGAMKNTTTDNASGTSDIQSDTITTTEIPLQEQSTTTFKPESTGKTEGIWTLVASSMSPVIRMSTKIGDTSTDDISVDDTSINENSKAEIKPTDDILTSIYTVSETTMPPVTRKNSKFPVEILTVSQIDEVSEINKTHQQITSPTSEDPMTSSSEIIITSIAHSNNASSSAPTHIISTTQLPEVVMGSDAKDRPGSHGHHDSILYDHADDTDDDYGYFSDDNLDDLDFLSKSHNEDVFEFISGYTKTESHPSTTVAPTVAETTPSFHDQDQATTAQESVGTVRISAPISVIDPNSTQNQSLFQDILDSKSKVRTTESDGVIYMDPKFTDIKIENPEPGRNENVSVIPHATEVFELSEETSAQTETESPVDRVDIQLIQHEKKKEPRIQDASSPIEAENRQGNSNFKVIPFVVGDALRRNQNRTQTILVSQGETLTTEDVVTDFCFVNGRLYVNGEMIVKTDPCELCRCFYGRELCQLQRCPAPPAPDCVPEYLPGFCCPRLTCGKNGTPEKTLAEQVSVPLKRHHAIRPPHPPVTALKPPAGAKPHGVQIRPANQHPVHVKPNDQSKPTVIIHKTPFQQGTPYRPPQAQQPDRFLLESQGQKQANEVRPNLQLNLPTPPSRASTKDEIVTPIPTTPPLKYGLRVRPPTIPGSTPQTSVKWTTTSSRVTRSTTMSRTPSSSPMAESSTPPFRRQSTSRKSTIITKPTTAATTTTTTSRTYKPTTTRTTPKSTTTTSTLPTTAYEASQQNSFVDPWGLLKVSGCNIYGKFYNVNERVEVLSGPCSHCICAANGVECNDIC